MPAVRIQQLENLPGAIPVYPAEVRIVINAGFFLVVHYLWFGDPLDLFFSRHLRC